MFDPILALGNALIMLNEVECKGETNHDYLLSAMQQIKQARNALKGGKTGDADDQQGKNV